MSKAKAPKPGGAGTTGGKEKIEAARQEITITLKRPRPGPDGSERAPITRSLHPSLVPLDERVAVRRRLRIPYEDFLVSEGMDVIGLDTIQVFWWLATRAESGTPVTLDKAMEDWPDELSSDVFEVVFDDGEDDDPQS